jgi:S-adenosylmethionine:tRNA ribosyltransferase-isomerase
MEMKLKDFSYSLPDELIAQQPRQRRDQSRMLFVDKNKDAFSDCSFFQLPDFLKKGDVLVVNDSRVIPARLFGKKSTGGMVEILLLTRKKTGRENQSWEVLLRPAKRMRENDVLSLGHNCEARVLKRLSDKKWLLEFFAPEGFDAYLDQFGRTPLPPYIKRARNSTADHLDRERYQTVYAKNPGSVAAPTAGLHFTDEMMRALNAKGVAVARVTLHVGYGTFLPIESEDVEKHVMDSEYYEINEESNRLINSAQRVVAVGTTSTRTIESAADDSGFVHAREGFTNLFIYPGYQFKRVDGLLTNFHLPQSSLFLLVCAFAGTDLIKKAYAHAVGNSYFFYSYGDCMLIL